MNDDDMRIIMILVPSKSSTKRKGVIFRACLAALPLVAAPSQFVASQAYPTIRAHYFCYQQWQRMGHRISTTYNYFVDNLWVKEAVSDIPKMQILIAYNYDVK